MVALALRQRRLLCFHFQIPVKLDQMESICWRSARKGDAVSGRLGRVVESPQPRCPLLLTYLVTSTRTACTCPSNDYIARIVIEACTLGAEIQIQIQKERRTERPLKDACRPQPPSRVTFAPKPKPSGIRLTSMFSSAQADFLFLLHAFWREDHGILSFPPGIRASRDRWKSDLRHWKGSLDMAATSGKAKPSHTLPIREGIRPFAKSLS